MEQEKPVSAKGRRLGIPGLIIGIIGLLFAVTPLFSPFALLNLVGCLALYFAIPAVLLCAVAYFLAKRGNNPHRKPFIIGFAIGLVTLVLAIYWIRTTLRETEKENVILRHRIDSMLKSDSLSR